MNVVNGTALKRCLLLGLLPLEAGSMVHAVVLVVAVWLFMSISTGQATWWGDWRPIRSATRCHIVSVFVTTNQRLSVSVPIHGHCHAPYPSPSYWSSTLHITTHQQALHTPWPHLLRPYTIAAECGVQWQLVCR